MNKVTLIALSFLLLAPRFAIPADAGAKKSPLKIIDPAYAAIADDPKLPRVLLIGDSISVGYTLDVRGELAGVANVHRPSANCGSTRTGLQRMEQWLDGGKWDVIHFNFGLHDLSYRFPDDSDRDANGHYATPDNGGHQNVSPVQYEQNLRQLVARMKRTGARLIFSTTTPVPECDAGKYVKDSEKPYNEVARALMAREGVALNDLWAFSKPHQQKLQIPRNVHFHKAGSAALAKQVATAINKQLETRNSLSEFVGSPQSDDLDLAAMIRPAPPTAKFSDPDYYIWCGTMVRGPDGKCHLYYSRWPRKLGFNAWVTHSEVAHAVGDGPLGPFRHVDVALPPRGKQHWDGLCTHNPTVYKFDGKYYLYYMGNTGDGVVMKTLNWTHRNNQRTGVAVAASPNGPWQRFEKPLIDVGHGKDAPDALVANNPAITRRPDGGYLMIYKAVGRKLPLPAGGPVVHCIATADRPTGPFTKQKPLAFTAKGETFPAEDPFIWHDAGRGRYYAVVKDNNGVFTNAGRSLALFTSENGMDWRPARHRLVSKTWILWADGLLEAVNALERPQIFFENGLPVVLLAASDGDESRGHSFNVQIPLASQ